VWYPAAGIAGEEPAHHYSLALAFAVPGRAYRNAPIAETATPFPLIIFSHGSGGSRLLSLFYTQHLASHGFIVMAADHPGNTVLNTVMSGANFLGGQDFVSNYAQRPHDILRQIALAEDLNASGDFAGKIDVANIGVTGHSFGGWTALSVGGARLNFAGVRDWCETNQGSDQDNICFLLDIEAETATARGYETAPTGAWEATTDPRIKAVVAFAPWNAPSLDLTDMTIPTMIMVGGADRTTPPERDADVFYAALQTDKTLVTFAHGGHYLFIDACPPLLLDFGAFDVCSDLVWDLPRAHDITNHLATAFFLQHLRGETVTAFAPDTVHFVGVSYKTAEN
jgi:predicted dienelactone hydrolase